MGMETVGRVLTEAKIENLQDQWDFLRGMLPAEQVRSAIVPDALVDTGATRLSLPTSLISQLGLRRTGSKQVRTSLGIGTTQVYEAVRLTIQDRDCLVDVVEVPDGTPILIGQVPLELLDFIVDPKNHVLIGDPRHGGEFIIEMY